jgi:hypothetical protein
VRKLERRLKVVELLCTHIWKWKLRPAKTIIEMGEERRKKNDGGCEFNYIIL